MELVPDREEAHEQAHDEELAHDEVEAHDEEQERDEEKVHNDMDLGDALHDELAHGDMVGVVVVGEDGKGLVQLHGEEALDVEESVHQQNHVVRLHENLVRVSPQKILNYWLMLWGAG